MSTDTTAPGGVNKTLLAALGGVVVLALVGMFVVLPLMAPEAVEEDPAVAAAAAAAAAAATEQPTEEPTAVPDEELPPIGDTFEVFSARDPFDQLVSDEQPVAAPVVDGEPTGDTASPAPDGSEETVEGEPVSAPADSTSEDGTTVEVEDVFSEDGTEYVLLTANGTAYTLAEGDTFATSWRVETIDDPCVTLLYGDQARLVCEGESIRK